MELTQFFSLIRKEILTEWRQRYAINGILLYLASTIFVCYMSFILKAGNIDNLTWNALFWIILLFASVNSVAKSFIQDSRGRQLYYYSVASPQAIIVSKTVYNAGLTVLLALLGFFFYGLVMSGGVWNIQGMDIGLFMLVIVLAATGFAGALTMVSGIASKADNSSTLMAVLSFPVMIPMVITIIKLSKNAMDGLERASSSDELLTLVAINAIIIAVSYILFPYLWRS